MTAIGSIEEIKCDRCKKAMLEHARLAAYMRQELASSVSALKGCAGAGSNTAIDDLKKRHREALNDLILFTQSRITDHTHYACHGLPYDQVLRLAEKYSMQEFREIERRQKDAKHAC